MSEDTPTYGLSDADRAEIERRKAALEKKLVKKAQAGQLAVKSVGGGGRIPKDVPTQNADEYRKLRSQVRESQAQRMKVLEHIRELGAKMKALRAVVTIAALLLFAPAIAWAAETAAAATVTQEWWKVLVQFLVSNGLQLLGAVLVLLIGALLSRLKIGLELTLVEKAVAAGVGYAEQLASTKLKQGTKTTGAQKMEEALALVQAVLDKYGVKGWAEAKLKQLIEAKLGAAKVETVAMAVAATASPVKLPAWAAAEAK